MGKKNKTLSTERTPGCQEKNRFQGLAYINLAKWNHISHIFHQPRFRRNSRGFPFQNATFWGENSCEVALIWPNQYILAIFVWKNVDLWYCRYWHSVVAQLAMRVCGHPKPPQSIISLTGQSYWKYGMRHCHFTNPNLLNESIKKTTESLKCFRTSGFRWDVLATKITSTPHQFDSKSLAAIWSGGILTRELISCILYVYIYSFYILYPWVPRTLPQKYNICRKKVSLENNKHHAEMLELLLPKMKV